MPRENDGVFLWSGDWMYGGLFKSKEKTLGLRYHPTHGPYAFKSSRGEWSRFSEGTFTLHLPKEYMT